MRFMIMHKNDPETEAGKPPPMDLVQRMGAFIGEHAKAGRFIDGAGLGASSTRTRLVFKNGRPTTKRGPYAGERELPGAWKANQYDNLSNATAHFEQTVLVNEDERARALQVKTREEALGWAERYGKILGDGELEVGKLNEPWDIGLMPAPENPPLRMLLIEKADQATEAGGRDPKQKAQLSRLKTEMSKAGVLAGSIQDINLCLLSPGLTGSPVVVATPAQAGVLAGSIQLQPSAKGKRLVFKHNDLKVIDGPFAESKELIGGFSVMELAGMDEALELCRNYAQILGGTLEIDVRLVDVDDAEG